ncbi:hypothetical protein GCM10023201_03940 [Actinomycetospora corticicola]
MAPAPSAALPPVAQDPTSEVSRTAEGRPDTGEGPSDVPLVLGALAVGGVAAGAIRYRMLHRRMAGDQPAGPAPEPVVGESGRHAAPAADMADGSDDATQLAPVGAPAPFASAVEEEPTQMAPFRLAPFAPRPVEPAFGAGPFHADPTDHAPLDGELDPALADTTYVERVVDTWAARPYLDADLGADHDTDADTTIVERVPAGRS